MKTFPMYRFDYGHSNLPVTRENMMPLKHKIHDPIPVILILIINYDDSGDMKLTKSSDTHPVTRGPVAAPTDNQ